LQKNILKNVGYTEQTQNTAQIFDLPNFSWGNSKNVGDKELTLNGGEVKIYVLRTEMM